LLTLWEEGAEGRKEAEKPQKQVPSRDAAVKEEKGIDATEVERGPVLVRSRGKDWKRNRFLKKGEECSLEEKRGPGLLSTKKNNISREKVRQRINARYLIERDMRTTP